MSYSHFGQFVIGPSGSGKSSYCALLQQNQEQLKRRIVVINLDPGAGFLPYECSVDIREISCLEGIMREKKIGPNGALIECMETLFEHIEWLEREIEKFDESDYLLFDCPGQIELYSHLRIMPKILNKLIKSGFSICTVSLHNDQFI